jgi:hypothetical protein
MHADHARKLRAIKEHQGTVKEATTARRFLENRQAKQERVRLTEEENMFKVVKACLGIVAMTAISIMNTYTRAELEDSLIIWTFPVLGFGCAFGETCKKQSSHRDAQARYLAETWDGGTPAKV